jgi:hypothetical protein
LAIQTSEIWEESKAVPRCLYFFGGDDEFSFMNQHDKQ